MKVLIAAGGTGGHIYPGIAVANEILRRDAESEILFVGTARGIETRIVPDNGFQLSLIHSAGLKNVGLAGKLKGVLILPRSFLEAREIIRDFKPDVVVGAGGYVSGPVLLTARFMPVPTVVLEPNAMPGFTNRRLARFIDKAALAFEEAIPFFGNKGVVTGITVRREFFEVPPKTRGEQTNILVFGGSQGSVAINNAVLAALPLLSDREDSLVITHQTGEANFENVKAGYSEIGWTNVDIRPYISDIFVEFGKADLIICRAGAATCGEVAAAGKAVIMVPFPGAADDHQRKNAEALERAGAARMILQKDLDGKALADEIRELIASPDKITEMEEAARKLARPDAVTATVDLIEGLRK